jgi:hypothetical protein
LSLGISEALNFSVVSRIPRMLIVTALAGTMTMPSLAQAPKGQKRGTGDTTTQKEETERSDSSRDKFGDQP